MISNRLKSYAYYSKIRKLTDLKVMFCEKKKLSLAFKWSAYQSGIAPKRWYFGRNLLNKLSAAVFLRFFFPEKSFFSL